MNKRENLHPTEIDLLTSHHVVTLPLADEITTQNIAKTFAQIILADFQPYRFYLSGDLGAGKTAFTRYFLKAMGVTGLIKSPTYTLIENYIIPANNQIINQQNKEMHILHSDLYRINDPEEIYDLGLLETVDALWLVEWPDKGHSIMPPADIDFELFINESNHRYMRIKIIKTHNLAPSLLYALEIFKHI